MVRFDKFTEYSIVPKSDKYNYIPKDAAAGITRGPYGMRLSHGSFELLQPIELIRDHFGVWRDGDGERLEQPKSTSSLLLAQILDFFVRTNRGNFRYKVPTGKLMKVGIVKALLGKDFFEYSFILLAILGLTATAVPDLKRMVLGRSPDKADEDYSRRYQGDLPDYVQ